MRECSRVLGLRKLIPYTGLGYYPYLSFLLEYLESLVYLQIAVAEPDEHEYDHALKTNLHEFYGKNRGLAQIAPYCK